MMNHAKMISHIKTSAKLTDCKVITARLHTNFQLCIKFYLKTFMEDRLDLLNTVDFIKHIGTVDFI